MDPTNVNWIERDMMDLEADEALLEAAIAQFVDVAKRRKISAIKALRQATKPHYTDKPFIGLKDAKDIVDFLVLVADQNGKHQAELLLVREVQRLDQAQIGRLLEVARDMD